MTCLLSRGGRGDKKPTTVSSRGLLSKTILTFDRSRRRRQIRRRPAGLLVQRFQSRDKKVIGVGSDGQAWIQVFGVSGVSVTPRGASLPERRPLATRIGLDL